MFSNYSGTFPNGPSYYVYQCMILNGGNTVANQPNVAFQSQGSYKLTYQYNDMENFSESGTQTNNSDYITILHNSVFHTGYGPGWSSGIDFYEINNCDTGGCPGVTSPYSGAHNIVAWNASSGNYDGSSNHTDGNGIIIDENNSPVSSNPYSIIANNVTWGNGGRGIACDGCSNTIIVNNTSYSDGLDTSQNTYNGEFQANNARNVYLINDVFYSWNSHSPIAIFGTSSVTCAGTVYYGGSNYGGCSTGLASGNPNFLNPTAVASPHYTTSGTAQYENTLPASTGLLNNLTLTTGSAALTSNVNPQSYFSDSNIKSGLSKYASEDFNGTPYVYGGGPSGAYQ